MSLISAELPNSNSKSDMKIRETFKIYQIHTCVANRCFNSHGKIFSMSKYGFPFPLQLTDQFSTDGLRHYYKRRSR